MKKQKSILLTVAICWAAAFQVQAQEKEYTHTVPNESERTIAFSVSRSDVVVEGHDSDQFIIRNMDYEAPPERAEGLKALYSADDNTGIGLSVVEEGNYLTITDAGRNSGEYRLMVPNNVRVMIEQVNWGGGDIEIRNHGGEIEILSKTGDIQLQNVTGPVIASSTSGNVDIEFSSLNQATPTSISLVSGYIDVTLPADSRADFILGSISGEIYTDLELEMSGDSEGGNMQRIGGARNVEAAMNGGGVEVGLKSISGDIFLRSKQ